MPSRLEASAIYIIDCTLQNNMSQASPRAVVSSAYWDTEREFWQSEESLVQDELVIRNLDDGDSGEADLSQPFDIRWQTFSPNENILYVI